MKKETKKTKPQVKEVTITKTKKMPLEGIEYSSRVATVSLVVEVPKEQKELTTKQYSGYWRQINEQLELAHFPETKWVHEQLEKAK